MESEQLCDAMSEGLDTVRALCHDLRQPLAAILLLAGAEGGDIRSRLDGILDQATWLVDVVEAVIGDAAGDVPERVDVAKLAWLAVRRAQRTTDVSIGCRWTDRVMATASPVALARAIGTLVDNAVRAAGPGGHVLVEVTECAHQVTIRVTDDGPGLGLVPAVHSLGLTITRALVSACGGEFELKNGTAGGAVAEIVLEQIVAPVLTAASVAS
jgi:signal transduction histidine kinase